MLDAEVRIGELMRDVPKAKNQYESASNSGVTGTKHEVFESMGFNKMQVQRFETLAAHPEIVAQAKAEGQLQRRCKEKTKARTPQEKRIRANAPLQWNNATTNSR